MLRITQPNSFFFWIYRVLLHGGQVERQLPEAMAKFERLLADHTERISKAEEHDVRLNLALGRLARNEERIQNCADRIERQPDLAIPYPRANEPVEPPRFAKTWKPETCELFEKY